MTTEILSKKACAGLSAYSDNKNKDTNTVNFKLTGRAQGGNGWKNTGHAGVTASGQGKIQLLLQEDCWNFDLQASCGCSLAKRGELSFSRPLPDSFTGWPSCSDS